MSQQRTSNTPLILTAVLVVAGIALAAVYLLGGFGGSESADAPVAKDPQASEATEAASTPTTEASESSDAEATEEPSAPAYEAAAMDAVNHDFAAMVPSILPAGWTVGEGMFMAEPTPTWHLDITAPTGPVALHQAAGKFADVVAAEAPDAVPAADVNLSKWGTGIWKQFTGASGTVLALELKDSTVVLTAPDLTSAKTVAKSLLPAEDASPAGNE